MLRIIRGPALVGTVCLLAGCGGGVKEIRYPETHATLNGTVSYGKDRVGVGLVIAQNASGSSFAFLDEDGQFHLSNVPLGEVGIGVNTDAGKGQAMGKLKAQTQGKAKGPARVLDVPRKYMDPTKSGIKTAIVDGENHFDIVIPK